MDKDEIRRVVLNMIDSTERDNAELEISDVTEWQNDFADYKSDVTIGGVDPSVKITNTRWHEGNGYHIEFNSSEGDGKDKKKELVIEKNDVRTYLIIGFK